MAPYKLNPQRLVYLNSVSNAVLSPDQIDQSFWEQRSRAYRDYDGEHVDFKRLNPIYHSHQKERERWAKQHKVKFQWEAGAVFDCMIDQTCGNFVYFNEETVAKIQKAREEYFRNTPKRRKISSNGIVD